MVTEVLVRARATRINLEDSKRGCEGAFAGGVSFAAEK